MSKNSRALHSARTLSRSAKARLAPRHSGFADAKS
jgi:hypothetical protein